MESLEQRQAAQILNPIHSLSHFPLVGVGRVAQAIGPIGFGGARLKSSFLLCCFGIGFGFAYGEEEI